VTREEMIRIADLWVESALTLTEADLRKMTRLAAAQDRWRNRRGAAI
jgi:DSF synthase